MRRLKRGVEGSDNSNGKRREREHT